MQWIRNNAFLFVMIVAGIIRIPLLFVPGYGPDLFDFGTWSVHFSTESLSSFYYAFGGHQLSFPSYALYAPVLWVVGFFSSFLPSTAALKAPILFFDLVSGAVLYVFLCRFGYTHPARITAAYLFNPALLYAGMFWGQVDTVASFFLFITLISVFTRRLTLGWFFFTVAVFIKPQAVALLPFIAVAAVKMRGWRAVYDLLPAAALVVTTTFFYFGFDVQTAMQGAMRTVERYPYLSANALNIWFPFAFASGGFVRDDITLLSFISPRLVGIFLFAIVIFGISKVLWRKIDDLSSFFFTAALTTFSLFMVTTQMHERYLFFFFLLSAPLLAVRSWQWVWSLLSLGFLFNLMIVLVPRGLSQATLSIVAVTGLFLHLVLFAWCLSHLLSLLHATRSHRHPNA